jgi:hypothetical protein
MIKKSGSGYQVKSHTGKNLSKPGLTHAQAVKRLQQVEYFKHHQGKKK